MAGALTTIQRWRPKVGGQQIGLGEAGGEPPFEGPVESWFPPGDGTPISYRGQARPNDQLANFEMQPEAKIGYARSNTAINTVNWTAAGPIRPALRMDTTRIWSEQGRQTRALEGLHTNAPVGVAVTGRIYKERPGKMQGGRQNNLALTTYRGQSFSQTTLSLR